MGSPYTFFQTDTNLEKDGIVVDYGDFRFRIARAGGANTRFQKTLAARIRPFRRAIDAGAITDADADKILHGVFVDSVLLGWEDVTDEHGNPLEFTRENALKLFSDLPDLFRDLQQQASVVANFRREDLQDTIKN